MIKIMIIKVSPRKEIAPTVQQVLTNYGELIKARLGLHNVDCDSSSSTGIIILHLKGEEGHTEEVHNLKEELESLNGVTVQLQVM
ncbi:MAG: hypothetical protein ACRDD2_07760 [Sarcina sp.]